MKVFFPSEKNYLFAADAEFGELLVIAGVAVDVTPFGQETQRSDRSLTAETGEAFVVPRVPFVFHTLCTCRARKKSSCKQSNLLFFLLWLDARTTLIGPITHMHAL